MSFVNDLRVAFRSLTRTKGLAITVVLTLALGIGANAAIFTLVRGVLLKPLVNRDEDRLIYIRQSAPGLGGDDNATFSVPEIQDLRAERENPERVRRFLDRRVHHDRPGSASRSSGWRRQRQLLRRHGPSPCPRPSHRTSRRRPQRCRRRRSHVSFLGDHFQQRSFRHRQGRSPRQRDPRQSVCHRHRRPRTLRPVSAGHRNHRQRRHQPAPPLRDHGHRPCPSHDGALRPSRPRCHPGSGSRRLALRLRGHDQGTSRSLSAQCALPDRGEAVSRPDHLGRPDRVAGAARSVSAGLRHRVFQRRQPDPHANGSPRRRADDPCGARRRHGRATPHAAGREPSALQRRRCFSVSSARSRWWRSWPATPRAFRSARSI